MTFTWLFFRSHDLTTTAAYLSGLFAFQGGFEGAVIPVAALGWTPVSLLWTFVNVPEHVFRWSGLDGQARYHRYISALRRLADEEGLRSSTSPLAQPISFSATRNTRTITT